MKKRIGTTILTTITVLGLILVGTPPSEAALRVEPGVSESTSDEVHQRLRGNGGTGCTSASVISIRVDGADGEYTIDPGGKLKKGPGEVEYSGCRAGEQVSRTGGLELAAQRSTFGPYHFGPNRTFYTAGDSNSKFWAQQSYDSGLTTAFRWAPSDYVKSIAYGPALQAYAFKSPDNCSYNKAGQSKDYIFHWSCTGQSTSKMYYLWGQWEFRAAGPDWSGYATVTWDFNYGITYV
ncbi:hypothetical protein GCM10023346_08350 [Arthrobacter gyeryongensis]|uniref:Uncharacterized protein n=1 Tax=Arthrobacter gyeryongensis TaxID=1650592 RepID=A0ABP9S4F5_9MICC